MFYRHQYNWIGLCFAKLLFHISNCIRVVCHTVSQVVLKSIRWYDNDPYVYVAVLKVVADMDYVARKQVTTP